MMVFVFVYFVCGVMSFLDKINGGSEGEQMDLFDGKPFEDSIADAFEEESCDDEEIERIL